MMTPLFKKLNFKNHNAILVLNAPVSFELEMSKMAAETTFFTDAIKLDSIDFVIVFVTQLQEIETAITSLFPKINGDAIIWFCYPKGTSKKYKCEFNRDNGWAVIGNFGFEPVRMVAVDEDWSALRFRKTTYIKTLTRSSSFAISADGKARTQK
ncbi:hypothetical protein [Flavobacterium sp.]|jgi:hypothetical protein|uniref:hypothetical protein n=1 Tax=Flavobacterium sp. TaxID=239 RepID=UPI0022BF42A5|nr:hypothetical protein [Flavobacterium sp.]MCZ8230155.1 hypothetical protein [Flavobacterium sp.]